MFTTSVVCGYTRFVLPISIPFRQQCQRLSSTVSAPPRRKPIHVSSSSPHPSLAAPITASQTSSSPVNLFERSSEFEANSSLSAALSQMTRSSAILAGTAFAIATSLVGLSAYGVLLGTKTGLGVDDPRHFGLVMRSILSTVSPSVTSSKDPASETEDEILSSLTQSTPIVEDMGAVPKAMRGRGVISMREDYVVKGGRGKSLD